MEALLPITEKEKIIILTALSSLEDIVTDVYGVDHENAVFIKYKDLVGPLQAKISQLKFKY